VFTTEHMCACRSQNPACCTACATVWGCADCRLCDERVNPTTPPAKRQEWKGRWQGRPRKPRWQGRAEQRQGAQVMHTLFPFCPCHKTAAVNGSCHYDRCTRRSHVITVRHGMCLPFTLELIRCNFSRIVGFYMAVSQQ
jgi:hypothetical protein